MSRLFNSIKASRERRAVNLNNFLCFSDFTRISANVIKGAKANFHL